MADVQVLQDDGTTEIESVMSVVNTRINAGCTAPGNYAAEQRAKLNTEYLARLTDLLIHNGVIEHDELDWLINDGVTTTTRA